MTIWESPFATETLLEYSLSVWSVTFDDGHEGSVLIFDESVIWLRHDTWVVVSIDHGGNVDMFYDNQEVLFAIAGSFRP
jgi:hypothetical protein